MFFCFFFVFFGSVSLAVTGSQEFNEELAASANHNIHDPQINKSNIILPWISDESMESYMKRSRMQVLGTRATESELIAAASSLLTQPFIYRQHVGKHSNGSSIHHRKLTPPCIKLKAYYITNFLITNILKRKKIYSVQAVYHYFIQCSCSFVMHQTIS